MSSRKINHKPMLYIRQPITQFPNIAMQDRYFTREEPSKKGKHDKNRNMNELNVDTLKTDIVVDSDIDEENLIKTNTIDSDFQDKVEADSNPFDTKRKKQYLFQRVKNFKEMSIDEKLIYLENFPEQLSPVSCLYITENTTYTGVLLNNLENLVEITLPNSSKASLDKSDILEIRMLGFH